MPPEQDRPPEQGLDTIADRLIEIADLIRRPDWELQLPLAVMAGSGISSRYVSIARQLYQMRRLRAGSFGSSELFGEPAWDILLDLYVAYATGIPVSVTSACIGAAVPATTALRHLGQLHDEGLIIREHDERDQRRIHVRLSRQGVERMEAYFSEICGDVANGALDHGPRQLMRTNA